jgi:Thioredoxin domain-containing protein
MKLKALDIMTFEETIYDNCETCLVAFSRKDCHVCAEVIPMVEEVADEYEDKLSFYYVDVEEQRDLYNRFSLKGVPQLMFFKGGEFLGKLGGLVEEERLREKIGEVVND